jgi:ERCC4-related helicase
MVYCDAAKTSNEQINKLVKDTPREYQNELFRKAMGGNAIVYLPTGSGKTLVASMVINAMLKLNPGKMAAFLVHRIPLVYQQSQYLKKQNPRLRVEILAGDLTRFPGDREHWVQVIQKIAQKRIDVLVITAQIFCNFLGDEDATLKLSDVSCMVFDEAHNCKGNHVFAQIMRRFYDPLENRYKPLVLGLTASPAGASTIEDTREQLTTLLTTLRAHCIMPTLSNDLALHWNNPVTSYECKPLSFVQENLETTLVNYIQSICPKIEELSGMHEALSKTSASSINFKGSLRTVIDRCHSKEEYVQGLALAMHAMNIHSIVELNRVLGPSHAYEALDGIFQAVDRVRYVQYTLYVCTRNLY